MNLGYGLRLEQNQKLIMTPELRQAIKILQLSSLELTEYVNQAILENPLIEFKEEEPAQSQEKKEPEIDWTEYMREMRDVPDRSRFKEVKPEVTFENMVTKGISLHEHLLSQIGVLPLNSRNNKIAYYLIGNIDSTGYLAVTLEQCQKDLQVTKEETEIVLDLIHSLDPPGVGARNLRECLLIQLNQRGIHNPDLHKIIDKHLINIGAGRLNRVAQDMNLPISKVQELADIIKNLNPKPGASFGGSDSIRYIVPDVTVERIDGEYVILVNDNHTPRLTINKTYSSILNNRGKTDDVTKNFVENKLNQAVWLIRSIEQRRSTIYQVTETLVKMQREFFDCGIKKLKPMTLKQIAEQISVHESTVSRATSNKYIQTPHGIFEFKFFFTSGFNTKRGDCASSESIKKLMQEIVQAEDVRKPLSDQKIANFMKEKGINIARRTVTKYREELNIPNTGQRRRY